MKIINHLNRDVSLLIQGNQGRLITVNNLVAAGGGGVDNGASAANAPNPGAGFLSVAAPSRFDFDGAVGEVGATAAITNKSNPSACANQVRVGFLAPTLALSARCWSWVVAPCASQTGSIWEVIRQRSNRGTSWKSQP